jgi:periplasmic divalent cation tolerance protein
MVEIIEVATTVSSKKDGACLARLLVEKRLAACVQLSEPVLSVYRWQGKVEEAMECRLTIKSRRTLFAQIVDLLERHHPYDVPEIIATSLVECSPAYQDWLVGELQND